MQAVAHELSTHDEQKVLRSVLATRIVELEEKLEGRLEIVRVSLLIPTNGEGKITLVAVLDNDDLVPLEPNGSLQTIMGLSETQSMDATRNWLYKQIQQRILLVRGKPYEQTLVTDPKPSSQVTKQTRGKEPFLARVYRLFRRP